MKITSQTKALFLADMQQRLTMRGWSHTKLAEITGIHQSQVSRISAGKFKTFGSNVMRICMKLDLEPSAYWDRTKSDKDRNAIADSAIAIWDGKWTDCCLQPS